MSRPHLSVAEVRPEERTAHLEALAAELVALSWIAHVTQPPMCTERVFVRHQVLDERYSHVLAAPDDDTGYWCYWFADSGECIASADDPAAAAAVTRRLGERHPQCG